MISENINSTAYIYIGTELRQCVRRCKAERREMLRYEPGKDNRRMNVDRRRVTTVWDKLGSRD